MCASKTQTETFLIYLANGAPAVNHAPEPVAPQPAEPDYMEMVAKETEQVKQEYEAKLAEMKKMYEVEQTSKQKLQVEMAGLKDEYKAKVNAIEEHYQAKESTTASQDQGLLSVTPEGSSLSVKNARNEMVCS